MSVSRRATTVVRSGIAETEDKDLPYRIELWDGRGKIERVLARAARAMLARAIFKAAQREFPDRHIALRRGARVIAESP